MSFSKIRPEQVQSPKVIPLKPGDDVHFYLTDGYAHIGLNLIQDPCLVIPDWGISLPTSIILPCSALMDGTYNYRLGISGVKENLMPFVAVNEYIIHFDVDYDKGTGSRCYILDFDFSPLAKSKHGEFLYVSIRDNVVTFQVLYYHPFYGVDTTTKSLNYSEDDIEGLFNVCNRLNR